MLVFGLLSSLFDYLTFAVLLFIMKVPISTAYGQALFRTGWFVESVLSASMVVLVIRTRRPAFKSRPGRPLLIATACTWIATVLVPYTPLGTLFKFTPLPWPFLVMVVVILGLYMSGAEFAKHLFYQSETKHHPGKRALRRPKRPVRVPVN